MKNFLFLLVFLGSLAAASISGYSSVEWAVLSGPDSSILPAREPITTHVLVCLARSRSYIARHIIRQLIYSGNNLGSVEF